MSARKYQYLSDLFIETLNTITNREKEPDLPSPHTLLTKIQNAVDNNPDIDLVAEYTDETSQAIRVVRNGWIDELENYRKFAEFYNDRHKELVDERKRIVEFKSKGHSLALRYRILTTLGIGLTIMGIYALANYLSIPMPLLKIPASS